MANLFEVVYEGVSKSDAIPLLMYFVENSKGVVNIDCTEDFDLIEGDQLNLHALESLLIYQGAVCAFITLKHLKIDGITIPSVLLRFVKYGTQYDIDINFEESMFLENEINILIKEIHTFSKNIANKFIISSFFAGIEPASDTETRYFTNDKLGPLLS